MARKPLLSQTKVARVARQNARTAMYELVNAQSHGERYLRGLVLRGKAERSLEEDLELNVNTVVTNAIDMFGTADGCPESVSDVMRGLWKLQARLKFTEMVEKDPSMIAGFPAFKSVQPYNSTTYRVMLSWVEEEIMTLLKPTVKTICDISLCEFREATGTERNREEPTDKWMAVRDDRTGKLTELLVRPRSKSRRRVNGTAVINGKQFIDAVYHLTNYLKMFGR